MKYKLRIYNIKGSNKGTLSHEEYFPSFGLMNDRYMEIYYYLKKLELKEYGYMGFLPTAWKFTGEPNGWDGWERLSGY